MAPWIDIDEWRTEPEPHRYVHGGFEGTDTRFSFYLPPRERYAGRFLTFVEGGQGGHETRAAAMAGDGLGTIPFAIACGAFLVESNGGHVEEGPVALTRGPNDPAVTAYGANVQATRLARELAEDMYGAPPHHGYIVGGSGGGRALIGFERGEGLWDGCVQYVNAAGHGFSFPALITNVVRVLGPKVRDVAEAFEPGGSGDPFDGLTTEQRAELATLYRAGFQPGGEFQLEFPAWELRVQLITITLQKDFDPEYFSDFWTVPGYAGADGLLDGAVVEAELVVERVVTAGELAAGDPLELDRAAPDLRALDPARPVGLVLGGREPDRLPGAELALDDGRRLTCVGVVGGAAVVGFVVGQSVDGVAAGDRVRACNRDYLAYCHSYRHQVDRSARESRQLMVDGAPIHPQRPMSLQDVLVGVSPTGDFAGKLIYVANVNDSMSTPIGTPMTYAPQARARLAGDDRMRVWWNDRATHIQASLRPAGRVPVATTRLIDYFGSIEQAVLDVIAWVEDDVTPPDDTSVDYDDGRLRLPSSAAERGGIQPVVAARAAGGIVATVEAGRPVRLEAEAEVPPGAGALIALEWDFDGRGTWPYRHEEIDGTGSTARVAVDHVFEEPGTYFPSVRATAHRTGDTAARHGRVTNLARVRVEVEPPA